MADLYEELLNHAEEVYSFVKIKGSVSAVLDYIRIKVSVGYSEWNLHTLTNVQTIAILKDKEDRE